jgi:hypothetical protein
MNEKLRQAREEAKVGFDRVWSRIRGIPSSIKNKKSKLRDYVVDSIAGGDAQRGAYTVVKPVSQLAEEVIRNAMDSQIAKAEKKAAKHFRDIEEMALDAVGTRFLDKQRRFLLKRDRRKQADDRAREARFTYGKYGSRRAALIKAQREGTLGLTDPLANLQRGKGRELQEEYIKGAGGRMDKLTSQKAAIKERAQSLRAFSKHFNDIASKIEYEEQLRKKLNR